MAEHSVVGQDTMNRAAPLFACLYVREFPIQALLRLRPELRDKPCIVLDGDPPLQQLCSLNARARALGLSHGMTRIEAETFPDITILARSHAEEDAAKSALLECAGFFSPRIEDQNHDDAFLCVLDISGTEKLLGSPPQFGKTLLSRVKALHMQASIVIGGNVPAIIALARGCSSRLSVIPCGEEGKALAPMPLSVLDLSEAHAEIFSLWGIHLLGMLAELPEEALIARLGQEGKRLRQLARGELPHFFRPVEPPFSLIEHMELDTPVELLDSLLFVIGMMLEQLILRAAARIFALASATITLSLDGGGQHERTVRPALPSNAKQLWLKLILLDLEAHPPAAAVLALTLSAEHGVTSEVQMGLFSPPLPEPARLDVTMARICAIVGEENAGRAQLKDTHSSADDKESFRILPFTVSSGAPVSFANGRSCSGVRQIRPAENIAVFLQGQRPAGLIFRDMRYWVEQAYGPWLSSGEWWKSEPWKHGQWDLVAHSENGAMLCCCVAFDRLQSGLPTCWRMVALYD